MAQVHKIDNLSVRPRKRGFKRTLVIAENVTIVALLIFAAGAYTGYRMSAYAQGQIDQAVKAATATPAPSASPTPVK